MTTQSNPEPQEAVNNIEQPAGIARRRLLRAGLAAAPVFAALKSNTVLAGDTCITGSSFSSLSSADMKVSRGRTVDSSYTCKSHGYWRNNTGGIVTDAYKTGTKFISTTTGFVAAPLSPYVGLSLQQVLELTGPHDFARNIASSFCTAVAWPSDPKLLLTKAQIQGYWNGTSYAPFADQAAVADYLSKIYSTMTITSL
jgi:hypothetical protein